MSINEIEKSFIKTLDVRGRLCPMNFVYTKITLEQMNIGEILEVLVDYPPAVQNISDSCERQGLAEVLEIQIFDAENKRWKLILKKI